MFTFTWWNWFLYTVHTTNVSVSVELSIQLGIHKIFFHLIETWLTIFLLHSHLIGCYYVNVMNSFYPQLYVWAFSSVMVTRKAVERSVVLLLHNNFVCNIFSEVIFIRYKVFKWWVTTYIQELVALDWVVMLFHNK